jgi:hypothetical protein
VPGDVIINEVMADHAGLTELPETEYVEIYNATQNDISLSGWKFIYDGKESALPEVVLPAGVYAVLYRAGCDIAVASGALSLGTDKFPSALANTGKIIGLKNSKGIMIDEITYPKATRGKSYERSDDGTWHLSTDEKGGTPGAMNSPTEIFDPEPDPDADPGTEPVSPDPTDPDADSGTEPTSPDPTDPDADPGTEPVSPDPTDPDADPGAEPSIPLDDNSVPGDVIINEVMADPAGLTELPETEYVEVYNATEKNISLSGWKFIYDGKESALPEVILPAGVYAVLYRAGRDITVASGAISLGADKFPSALANTGKTIGLKNSKDVMIDEVAYPKATRGKSCERSDDGTWHLSTDGKGGTPGAMNSPTLSPEPNPDPGETPTPNPDNPVDPNPSLPNDTSVPGDVIINEVMADPVGLTELPETEYVEIYNATENNISLSGWKFIYDGKESALPEVVLPAGVYAVLYRAGRDITVASDALLLGADKFPSALANTGKTIGLKNSKDVMIDEVAYPKATRGKSYERSDDETWHLSTDKKGGTPGAMNSPALSSEPNPDTGETPEPNPDNPEEPNPNPNPNPPNDNSVSGDVLINEVMADPAGLTKLSETEYVEIYNVTENDIALSGWIFIYDGKETAMPDTVLPAGGYAVLYRSGRDVIAAEDALSLGIDKFPSALANTGKTIGLENSKGVMIDEITYPRATTGKSYERLDDETWHLSTDEKGGTPGAVNSPALSQEPNPDPGTNPTPNPDNPADSGTDQENPYDGIVVEPLEIVINEILPDPFSGGSEYIELYNRSGRPLSLLGLAVAVRKADGSLNTHYPLNTMEGLFLPESYVVLTKQYDGVANFYYMSSPEAVYEMKMPVLNNEGATIVLFRISDEIVIDEVFYSEKWHDISIKETKGVSLERINPEAESQDHFNWTSATAEVGYGTPGYKNSQYGNADSGNKAFINVPEYIPGFDYYLLEYQTNKPGYRCRAEVYSINGEKVAEISNNQLIAQEGELRWDGRGLDNSRLYQGIYIFYAELYHIDGDDIKIKKAFLVK